MSSFNGRFHGGRSEQRQETDHAAGVPDQWGFPREGETIEAWHAREAKIANAKLRGTPLEGRGQVSVQAGLAYEHERWNAQLKAGRDEFAAKQAREAAAAEAVRQQQLGAARTAKAAADARAEEDRLLQWAEGQRSKVPGRL